MASWRRSTWRESAHDGEPSGMVMSQNIRAEWCSPALVVHGSTWKVDGSGRATVSDSDTRAKPSIDDAVEADALLERTLQFGGRDGDRLEVSEHVGEPQPDEADVAFLQRAQHEFLLPIHVAQRRHRLLIPCYGGC